MAKYIVKKKGMFQTLYLDTPNYNRYQSATKHKNMAYQFPDLASAQRLAKSIHGEVIEVLEEKDHIPAEKIIRCTVCSYFDGISCLRTHMPTDRQDFCSRGFKK